MMMPKTDRRLPPRQSPIFAGERPLLHPPRHILQQIERSAQPPPCHVSSPHSAAQCGQVPEIPLDNQTPQEALSVGDIVTVGGDFPMTLTQVSSQGNGWYSGKGWLTLPWILDVNVAVKFNRLRVNTDNRQIAGEVETGTDPNVSQIANTNKPDNGSGSTSGGDVEIAPPGC